MLPNRHNLQGTMCRLPFLHLNDQPHNKFKASDQLRKVLNFPTNKSSSERAPLQPNDRCEISGDNSRVLVFDEKCGVTSKSLLSQSE